VLDSRYLPQIPCHRKPLRLPSWLKRCLLQTLNIDNLLPSRLSHLQHPSVMSTTILYALELLLASSHWLRCLSYTSRLAKRPKSIALPEHRSRLLSHLRKSIHLIELHPRTTMLRHYSSRPSPGFASSQP
jgi:hypothetical protein